MQFSTFNAATSIVAHQSPCTLYRVQGYFAHTGDAWLQIHDAIAKPATGAVPLKVYQLSQDSPFHWGFEAAPLTLSNGLFVGVSSTEGTYTEVTYSAGTTYADIEGDLIPTTFRPAGLTVEGDLTTGRDALTIWAGGSGTCRLFRLDYTNNDGDDRYLMLFATDSPTDGDYPVQVWGPVADGETLTLFFGNNYIPLQDLTTDCALHQSSTAPTITATSTTASYIRAYVL